MQQTLEAVGVLFVLFLILRVSLWARGRSFGLRGGLTTLNIASGALGGLAAAVLLQGGVVLPGRGGYADLAAAVRSLLPLLGTALGGIAGYLFFGTIWRRLLRSGAARTRSWLVRAEFGIAAGALAVLARRIFS